MVDEIKFPLKFEECPNCGSTRRVANEVLEKEKLKNNVGLGVNAFLFQHQSMIADARKPFLSAPIILTFYDACVDCGTVYCVHMDVKVGMPSMGKQSPMQFGKS